MRDSKSASVFRSLLRSPGKSLLMLAEQFAARAAAWVPVWLPMVFPSIDGFFPFSSLPCRMAFVLLFYLLIVYPMRALAACQLTRIVLPGKNVRPASYLRLLFLGAVRLFTGCLWGVPLGLLIFRMYQYFFVLPGSRYSQDLTQLSAVFFPNAPDANAGMFIYLGFMAFAALLLLYGWWRGMPYDFLMTADSSPFPALRLCRSIRRRCAGKRRVSAALHMALCLLSVAAPIAIIYSSLAPLMTGFAFDDVSLLYLYFSGGAVESKTLLLAFAAFLVLYLPFLPLRKARNARLIGTAHGKER